jgi:small subunit ribosomal protein S18
VDKTPFIDYKDVKTIRFFLTERGKILPRRISGNCARHQREVTVAVQRCRNIALVPFSGESRSSREAHESRYDTGNSGVASAAWFPFFGDDDELQSNAGRGRAAVLLFFRGFYSLLGMMFTRYARARLRPQEAEGLSALGLSIAIVGAIAGWQVAAALLLCFGLMAVATAEGLRRQWKPEATALAGGLLPVTALTLIATRFFLSTNKNPVTFIEALLQEQRALAAKLYTDLKLTEVAAAVSAVPDTFIHYVVLLLPGIVVTSMILLAAGCFVLSVRIITRKPGSAPAITVLSLAQWHAPDVWVWGLIVTLVLILVPDETVKFTGWNLAILYSVIYLIQGISLVEHYLRKARVHTVVRGLIHAIILALPPTVACVMALGVVDIWADFRKVRGPVPPS